MPYETVAFHTCEDRGNIDRIEKEGPYMSYGKKRKEHLSSTFLSPGYYFWEDGIESAHWWGKSHCQPDYAILECGIQIDRERLLDLAGNPFDKKRLVQMAAVAFSKKIPGYDNPDKIPVGALLDFIRGSNTTSFPFDAVRVSDSTHTPGGGRPNVRQLSSKFSVTRYPYIDECQYILCIFRLDLITSKRVVYPE